MSRPVLKSKAAWLNIRPEEIVSDERVSSFGVREVCYAKFYDHPSVVAAGITLGTDDYMNGAWATWLKAHQNTVHCYAAPREDFFKHVGLEEAKKAGKPFAYLEDLS